PKALKKIRDKIAGDPKGWGRATTGGALGSTCRMAGESLKRPPAGYDPAHPFIEDIKRKDFAISTPLTHQEVTGDDFLDLVLQTGLSWSRLWLREACTLHNRGPTHPNNSCAPQIYAFFLLRGIWPPLPEGPFDGRTSSAPLSSALLLFTPLTARDVRVS